MVAAIGLSEEPGPRFLVVGNREGVDRGMERGLDRGREGSEGGVVYTGGFLLRNL